MSDPDVNSLALATATITRVRNANASAVHYRMSTIMFYSDVKHDLIRLNPLGVCMSLDAIEMRSHVVRPARTRPHSP